MSFAKVCIHIYCSLKCFWKFGSKSLPNCKYRYIYFFSFISTFQTARSPEHNPCSAPASWTVWRWRTRICQSGGAAPGGSWSASPAPRWSWRWTCTMLDELDINIIFENESRFYCFLINMKLLLWLFDTLWRQLVVKHPRWRQLPCDEERWQKCRDKSN